MKTKLVKLQYSWVNFPWLGTIFFSSGKQFFNFHYVILINARDISFNLSEKRYANYSRILNTSMKLCSVFLFQSFEYVYNFVWHGGICTAFENRSSHILQQSLRNFTTAFCCIPQISSTDCDRRYFPYHKEQHATLLFWASCENKVSTIEESDETCQ